MKTAFTTLILSVLFLSAGAFASIQQPASPGHSSLSGFSVAYKTN